MQTVASPSWRELGSPTRNQKSSINSLTCSHGPLLPTKMSPPIIHLGAVTYSHNNTPYAIRAEVAFDFRSAEHLTSVRLTSLTQPESPDFVPSAIDLFLYGRWQTALSSLRKRTVVEIQNASVKRSDDADINPICLELVDPPFPNVAVYVLVNGVKPTQFVTAATVVAGLQPCPQAVVSSFQGRSAPWATPVQQQVSHTRVTIADAPRGYEYTPIGVLSNPEGPIPYDPTKKYNIFGVVLECRAPSIAKTGTLRSEIVIADESSLVGIEPGEMPKSIAVFTFETNPRDAIPFRAIGDVVRVHRVHLKEFNVHGDGERRRSAMAKFYSSIVMWEYEGKDFLPFTTREPVRQQSAEHRISVQDRNRVRELRKWAKEYVFQYHKIPRKELHTPSEIIKAPSGTPWLSHTQLDVICLVEPETYIDESEGILTFLAADGFSRGNRRTRIAVQSESMQHCDHQYNAYSFIQFCPSWRLRPTGRPAWVVLRDVSIVKRNGERIVILHAGQRTSSIIWNSEGSPDYRSVKSKFEGSEMPLEPISTINPQSHNEGYGYGQVETASAAAPTSTEQHPEPQAKRRSDNHAIHVQQNSTPPSSNRHPGSSYVNHESLPKAPLKRLDPEGDVRAFTSPFKRRKGNSAHPERREPTSVNKSVGQSNNEATMNSVPLRRELAVITENEHGDIPVSSIATMLRIFREGNKGAHRLRITARACSSPTDVRFACRPWCNRCNKYLRIETTYDPLECLTCGDIFSNIRDSRMGWVYSVKLILEDSAGGKIEGWIEGKEGTIFFSERPPTNLLSNPEARRQVSKNLQVVLSSKNRLDCSVKPYEYEDKQGFYRLACKIFATKLLPKYIASENKN